MRFRSSPSRGNVAENSNQNRGRSLGSHHLNIGAEIAPGVPWCFANSSGHEIAITLKSGNFGQEGFFTQALAVMT
jgi:3-dehydrotetronate 4-kinase